MGLHGVGQKNTIKTSKTDYFHEPVLWCCHSIQDLTKHQVSRSFLTALVNNVIKIAKAVFTVAIFIPSVALGLVGDLFLSSKVTRGSLDFTRASTSRLIRNLAQEVLTNIYRSFKYQGKQIDEDLANRSGIGRWHDAARSFNRIGFIHVDAIESYGLFLQKEFSHVAFVDGFLRSKEFSLDYLPSKQQLLDQEKKLLVIPIGVDSLFVKHAMMVTVDIENDTIEFYDPKGLTCCDHEYDKIAGLKSCSPARFIDELKSLYLSPNAKLIENTQAHQKDDFNCAVYACDYAWRRASGESAEQVIRHGRSFTHIIGDIRARIIDQLLQVASDEDVEMLRQMWREILEKDGLRLENAPKSFINDPELVFIAMKQRLDALKFVGEDLKGNFDFFEKALSISGMAFLFANESLREDYNLALKAVCHTPEVILSIGKGLEQNRDFMLAVVKENGIALKLLPVEFQNDPEIVLAAAEQNLEAIEFVGEKLQGDKDFFLKLVEGQPSAFQFIPSNLQENEEIALSAMTQDVDFLRFIGPNLRISADFFSKALRKDGLALEFASLELRGNEKLLQLAVGQNVEALSFADKETYKNPKIMRDLVKINSSAMKYADKSLKSDKSFVESVVLEDAMVLKYVDSSLKENAFIAEKALRQNVSAFEFVGPSLQKNKDFILNIVSDRPEIIGVLDEILRSNRAFIFKATAINPKCALYAPESMRSKFFSGKSLVEANGLVLEFLDESLRDNAEIVQIAIRQNKAAFHFASERLRKDSEFRFLLNSSEA